jgi:hypothetical protein
MEKIDVAKMDVETLKEEIMSLPARIPAEGLEFTWRETAEFDIIEDDNGEYHDETLTSLTIEEVEEDRGDFRLSIWPNGSIKSYTFPATAGSSDADAESAMRRYRICYVLLSAEFRQAIVADYNSKAETLHSLVDAYKAISAEQKRRRDTR